jgi:acyl phosphate:glycerol-3-phosphate acyltransferase
VLFVLLAILIGYLLGSVPVATLVSRRRGVDIFTTGTGLAGAANVYRTVGHFHGTVVLAGDAAKGVLTIFVAHRLGVEGTMSLLPGVAALMGHWRSLFNGFRGGDGLSTLLGITLASLPVLSLPVIGVGIVMAGFARLTNRHASIWGAGAGYGLLLAMAPFFPGQIPVIVGISLMALMVLAHAVVGYRRRRWSPELDDRADESQPENSTT